MSELESFESKLSHLQQTQPLVVIGTTGYAQRREQVPTSSAAVDTVDVHPVVVNSETQVAIAECGHVARINGTIAVHRQTAKIHLYSL